MTPSIPFYLSIFGNCALYTIDELIYFFVDISGKFFSPVKISLANSSRMTTVEFFFFLEMSAKVVTPQGP